jgi:hypothetical protein
MRNYAGSAMMLVTTMVAAVGCYTINLKVSSERAGVEALRTQLVADAREIRNLQAELRTRARFPELQRWNDNVLQMSAPVAGQFLRSPVQLAGYAAAPATAEPGLVYTVTTPESVAPMTAPMTAPLVEAAYQGPPAGEARLIRAGYSVPRRMPVPEVVMAAPLPGRVPAEAVAARRAPAEAMPARRAPAEAVAARRAPAGAMPTRNALTTAPAKPERLQIARAENRTAAPPRPAARRATPAPVETPLVDSAAASPALASAPGAPVDLLPKGGL